MRHAILGPGGVGGLIGACLAHAGDEVTMVVRPGTLEQFPDQLQLESPLGNVSGPVKKAEQVPPADVLWIAVKATQLENSLRSVPSAEIAGAIVPLLNGIDHVAVLRARFGHERVVPAAIAGETERVAPGHIVHRSPFAILNVAASGRERLSDATEKLHRHGFTCRFLDDEATLLWGKLVFLAPFALTTTAFDTTVGRVFANAQWRSQAEAAIREVCSVAIAEAAQVDVERVLSGSQTLPFDMRSSMQKDVDRGNPPELEAIGGPIVRGGARHGIAVPVTRALMAEVEKRATLRTA